MRYSITQGNNGNLFAIDAVTGEVTVANNKTLNFNTPLHTLTIRADDQKGLTDDATLTVRIVNPATNPPSISDAITNPIPEDKPAGTQVFDVNDVSGNDTDRDGEALTYSIVGGNNGGIFAIDQATGVIRIADNQQLDFDAANRSGEKHDLIIRATDGTTPVEAKITIRVANVNDNNPQLQNQRAIAVPEDTAAETEVFDVNDTSGGDTDLDGAQLSYSIIGGNNNGLFSINQNTGVISIAANQQLDFDAPNNSGKEHNLVIRAEDNDGKTGSATITIPVSGVNDNSPAITNGRSNEIPEDSAANTFIFDVNDTSGDDQDNDGDQLNYAIIGGNNDGLFSIDQATGEMRIAANKQLDFDLPNGKQEHADHPRQRWSELRYSHNHRSSQQYQ